MSKQLLVITPFTPTGDPYSVSSYPGPGAYLTSSDLVIVSATGSVMMVARSTLPPLHTPAPPTPPSAVSEAGLIKIISLCLDRFHPSLGVPPGPSATFTPPQPPPTP